MPVHHYPCEESYWPPAREAMDELIATAARVVGLYTTTGARSDSCGRLRWPRLDLADDPARMRADAGSLELGLRRHEQRSHTRLSLHTRDMHRLYAKLGFAPPDERLMERWPAS